MKALAWSAGTLYTSPTHVSALICSRNLGIECDQTDQGIILDCKQEHCDACTSNLVTYATMIRYVAPILTFFVAIPVPSSIRMEHRSRAVKFNTQ